MSHYEVNFQNGESRVTITRPDPPWTQEDAKKISDYFYKGPVITLDSGIEISLQSLKQHLGYSSLLEGIPWGEKVEWVIKQEIRWFKESCKQDDGSEPAFAVIEPQLMDLPFSQEKLESLHRFYKRKPVSIGPVACRGYFKHDNMVRVEDGCGYSGLTIIWFQEGFQSPMPEYVVEQIKKIDWESAAENFEW